MSEVKKLGFPAFEDAGRGHETSDQSRRAFLVVVQAEACVLALGASLLPPTSGRGTLTAAHPLPFFQLTLQRLVQR